MIKPLLAVALAAFTLVAAAQSYPSRPITLISPFPPGGSTDTAARIIGERMRAALGQPVVVETVGGAGGTIALARVARAAPDGYTIDIGQWDTHVGAIIYPISFDLQKDFEPIGLMTINPQLLVARKGFPAEDLKDMVAWLKANPGKASFVDQFAAARLAGIQMMQATGTTVEFIPFRGGGPAIQAMLGGQVDLMVIQAAAGLYASGWFGLFAPRGTPKEIIARLNSAMVQALAEPALRARFAELGLDVASREQQSAQGLAAFHKAEIEKWWPIIKAANIRVE